MNNINSENPLTNNPSLTHGSKLHLDSFLFIAFVVALIKLIFFGDTQTFTDLVASTFDNADLGFRISLGLTGIMTLWLGLMKVGENGGVIRNMARVIGPLFRKLLLLKNVQGYTTRFENFSQVNNYHRILISSNYFSIFVSLDCHHSI